MNRLFIAVLFIFPVTVFAQVAASPTPTPAVIDTLTQIDNAVPGSLPVWLGMILGFVIDLIVRRWPTKNPTSLLLLISAALKLVINILSKLDKLVNDIVGQNVKPPEGPKA